MGVKTPTGSPFAGSMTTVVVVDVGEVVGAAVPVVGTVSTVVLLDTVVTVGSVVSEAVTAAQDTTAIARVAIRATDRELTFATLA